MKKLNTSFAAVCLAAFTLIACQKEVKEPVQNEISEQTLGQIKSLGFATDGIKKVDEGYLVEGDIILTEKHLKSRPTSPNLLIAQEEQYHTFNLVKNFPRTINVILSLDAASAEHHTIFTKALDEAIGRYNALNIGLKFQRVTSGTAHITIVAYNQNSSTLGSAGFPYDNGEPYDQIKMNTYHYSKDETTTNINYIGTIMSHEMGHCIGFRHTDYMSRRFSCGIGGNEGQEKTGVGAVHIPGTPTKAEKGSWMLACIGDGVNRPFTDNDEVALNHLY